MAFFFRGAVTSSPVKSRDTPADESCHSLGVSFLSDSSYECFSTNPLTGSVCQCRRSPRLLGNGYYVLTEDSFAVDDEGNVTLTPSKTNVSYKENLVRIFRRRRRVRKSLASLLSDVSQSCQSWLGGGVFGWTDSALQEEPSTEESNHDNHTPLRDDHPPLRDDHSSCVCGHTPFDHGHSSTYIRTPLKRDHTPIRLSHTPTRRSHTPDREFPHSFTYDPTENVCPPDKLKISQEEFMEEQCLSQEQCGQSVGGLLEVPPPTFIHDRSPAPADTPSGSPLVKALLLLLLMLCVCTAISSRWLMGGVVVTISFLLMSSLRKDVRWRCAKTEDITSRNE
ncbi:transmembrane protein 71 [Sardina pilchardus]|uniref:transmembrane protein 71 n=1 Tax=Sardina pilchardus TaxID=27697 RepID=UPI002E163D04